MFSKRDIDILKMAQTAPIIKDRDGKYWAAGTYQLKTSLVEKFIQVGYLELDSGRVVITQEGTIRADNE